MKAVVEYTDERFIKRLVSVDKYSAIEELAKVFDGTPVCTDVQVLIAALKDRERIMSTGIGFGIAIPHAKIEEVKSIAFAIGVSENGIDFDSMDGKPVHLIILVAAGDRQHKDYLAVLSNIMALLKDDQVKDQIIKAEQAGDVIGLIRQHGK